MNRQFIQQMGLQYGASAVGILRSASFLPLLDAPQRERLSRMERPPESVLIAAFPYYAGQDPGNIALYARGEDYVQANRRRLADIGQALALGWFFAAGNGWPLPVVRAAALAGVGKLGLHGLLIVPPYGSYVTLGALFTDTPLPETLSESASCIRCGACIRACPVGAPEVRGGTGYLQKERCLSYITQKREALAPAEEELVREAETAVGCDLCQRACPENRNPALSQLPEFTTALLPDLTLTQAEMLNLNDRAYGGRRLSPLLRNLRLREKPPPPE